MVPMVHLSLAREELDVKCQSNTVGCAAWLEQEGDMLEFGYSAHRSGQQCSGHTAVH